MAEAFTSSTSGGGSIVGRMEPIEREIVVEMLSQTRVLLGDEPEHHEDDVFGALTASFEPRQAPQDPALRRLLPDGSGADSAETAEFRRLTEDSIRRQKQRNLDVAIAAFADAESAAEDEAVVLSRPQARALMLALTDVRLVLAERLGLHTDADAEALHELVSSLEVPRSERDITAMYYDFVTWLAESVTLAYTGQA